MAQKITIVGLGPWQRGWLTDRSIGALRTAPVLLRTAKHPAARELAELGIPFRALDELYEQAEDFEELCALTARAVTEEARANGSVCYAVPGQGVSGDRTVQRLMELHKEQFDFAVVPSAEESAPFLALCALKGNAPQMITQMPASTLEGWRPRKDAALLVTQLDSRLTAGDVKLALSASFGDEARVLLGNDDGVEETTLAELDHREGFDHRSMALVLPPPPGSARYGLYDLVDILAKLRSPDGCPWDREQTHETLRQYLLEESYELIDAVENGDVAGMCEELGDVLLQVVFHAQIAAERGDFDITDVADGECRKMIRRHPHIFGDVRADTADDVVRNWEAIKKKEKGQNSQAGAMQAVPAAMPALMRAAKVQDKARKGSFDWPDLPSAFAKLEEEVAELKAELTAGADPTRVQDELGDVFFAAVEVSRFLDLHPELTLQASTAKFMRRFAWVEQAAAGQGTQLAEMSLNQKVDLWRQAKEKGL